MSAKGRDQHNRWRNQTIAFRVSPEEKEDIMMKANLSGLVRQEYLIRCARGKEIIVHGNPRIFKALKYELEEIRSLLEQRSGAGVVDPELLETIRYVVSVLAAMNSDKEDRYGG